MDKGNGNGGNEQDDPGEIETTHVLKKYERERKEFSEREKERAKEPSKEDRRDKKEKD